MNLFEHIEGFFNSKVEIAKGFWILFKLESKLASLSIIPLLICSVMLIAISMSFWFSVLILIGYLITYFTGGYVILSIISVLILNLIFFLLAVKYISMYLYRMSFARTRAALAVEKTEETYEHSTPIANLNR